MYDLYRIADSLPWWGKLGGVTITAWIINQITNRSLYHYKRFKINKLRQEFRSRHKNQKHEFTQKIKTTKKGINDERIKKLSLEELQRELQEDRVTAQEVLLFFQKKAIEVDSECNCIAYYIEEAQTWSKELDKATEKGALHGIPYTIKDTLSLEGYIHTAGNIMYNTPAKESWIVNKVLQDQGAIPVAITNVPYLLMSYSMKNPLYGEMCSPLDPTRSCGGSSGGEAALVAGGASLLSIGGDLGGSIRNPAAWCGVVGFKCCSKRISMKGTPSSSDGVTSIIPPGYGPISPNVDTAAFVLKHLLIDALFKEDPTIPPVPWRNELYTERRPLKIGYFEYNGLFRAVPSMERAVRIAVDKLQAMGHTVVPFVFPEDDGTGTYNYGDLWRDVVFADEGKTFLQNLAGDITDRSWCKTYTMPFPVLPRWLNLQLAKLVSLLNPAKGRDMEIGCGTGSTFSFWKLVTKLKSWQRACLAAVQEAELDAIVSPAFACPAILAKQDANIAEYCSYVTVYNLLDWPAGVLPVTKVTREDVQQMKNYPKFPPYSEIIKESMDNAVGLPVNVQVAVLPYQEELCLNIMKQIEDAC